MELKSLSCPSCGSSLKSTKEIDVYYCEHCGIKVQISGQSDQFYKSRAKLKELEVNERIQNVEKELELLRIKQHEKESRRSTFIQFANSDAGRIVLTFGGIMFLVFLLIIVVKMAGG